MHYGCILCNNWSSTQSQHACTATCILVTCTYTRNSRTEDRKHKSRLLPGTEVFLMTPTSMSVESYSFLPETVSRETSVEFQEALISEGLHSTVNRTLVRVAAVRKLLHFLNACLDKVKGQTAGCCTEASYGGPSQHDCLTILRKAGIF